MTRSLTTTINVETEAGNIYSADVFLSYSVELYGADADGRRGVMKTFYDVEKFTISPEPKKEKQEVITAIHEHDYSDVFEN